MITLSTLMRHLFGVGCLQLGGVLRPGGLRNPDRALAVLLAAALAVPTRRARRAGAHMTIHMPSWPRHSECGAQRMRGTATADTSCSCIVASMQMADCKAPALTD